MLNKGSFWKKLGIGLFWVYSRVTLSCLINTMEAYNNNNNASDMEGSGTRLNDSSKQLPAVSAGTATTTETMLLAMLTQLQRTVDRLGDEVRDLKEEKRATPAFGGAAVEKGLFGDKSRLTTGTTTVEPATPLGRFGVVATPNAPPRPAIRLDRVDGEERATAAYHHDDDGAPGTAATMGGASANPVAMGGSAPDASRVGMTQTATRSSIADYSGSAGEANPLSGATSGSATGTTGRDRARTLVTVSRNGFQVRCEFGDQRLKNPTEESRHRQDDLKFTGGGGHAVFARFAEVMYKLTTMVYVHRYDQAAGWALLRANLEGEAKELAYVAEGWEDAVSKLLT